MSHQNPWWNGCRIVSRHGWTTAQRMPATTAPQPMPSTRRGRSQAVRDSSRVFRSRSCASSALISLASSLATETDACLAEQRDAPVAAMFRIEREEQDALPGSEAERAVPERNRFRPRAEERRDDALARRRPGRDDPLEQRLEVL